MSELALFIVRAGFLLVLWLFVLSIIAIIRADLFSERVLTKVVEKNTPTALSAPTTGLTTIGEMSNAPGSATIVDAFNAVPNTLFVIDGPLAGTELAIDRRELKIGRAPNSDLVLDDDYVSAQHARIHKVEDGWMLQDLNSTNGTYVDGLRIGAPVKIQPGMQIRIGKTIFELRGQ
ncbi:MAG: FHA domain-containing protein [Micrococcales bacterium]|nr:FHA domain-containing protein [Micrococcales bacterium]NBS61405.1 FHA domain-containing protein [Microbacteriaceae bacterium]NBT48393.1 FHA domain-containing protein [Actinomycetota bacterium]NBY43706.1 FHA domain-containing protein [Micrococcales bacterium]